MAHSFARLRIAGPVAVPLLPSPPACPSQGSLPTCLAGLVGQDSHPQDDASVFLEGLAPPFLTDQPFLVALGPYFSVAP